MDKHDLKNKQPKLFTEFPQVSTEEWEAVIAKDLKGADYERKLIWKTMESFNVRPYYRMEDLKKIEYLDVFPGDFPFIRTNKKGNNNWLVRQDVKVNDIEKANKKALDILLKGIDSLGFVLDTEKKPSIDDIEKLMENIYAQIVEVNFICGNAAPEVFDIYLKLIKKYNRDLRKIHGSVDFDPIGNLMLKGNFYNSEEKDFLDCKELITASEHLPHFTTLLVNAGSFKNSGSSIVEELAFGLAYGNEYLSKLTGLGCSIDKVAAKIKFCFAVGSNYFMEIAKLRAARLLWAKIVNAYGPSETGVTKIFIHTVTSDWNKTLFDPYVNMLRTTTEAMSAIIGGTNSLTINPFNSIYEATTDFSERIARNQQLLLKEESYFDKIIDPSAGSYYIENLTDSIAEQAWELFLETDENGGFIESFKKGFIQDKIKETASKRNMAIATRKENFLGTNQYPNFNEHIEKELNKSVFETVDLTEKGAIAETLKTYRGPQAFELLRYRTDKFAMENKRPEAFMFTYGNIAMRKARSQFSCNFFACAGFEVTDNNGFKTIDEGIKACLDRKAEIVVICSSDDEYPLIAPEIYEKLKDHSIIVIAGYPKKSVEDLKAKGIKYFIHVKSNLLETLKVFQYET